MSLPDKYYATDKGQTLHEVKCWSNNSQNMEEKFNCQNCFLKSTRELKKIWITKKKITFIEHIRWDIRLQTVSNDIKGLKRLIKFSYLSFF